LRLLFTYWINGCINDYCEFGIFSKTYSAIDIGISFLSIYSLSYPVKYVIVYDILHMMKYRIGFLDIKVDEVYSFLPSVKKLSSLGQQIISNHWIKPIVDIGKVIDEINKQLKELSMEQNILKWLKSVSEKPRCQEEMIRILRNNDLIKTTILYRCFDPRDYYKLIGIIYLYRFLAGRIYDPNTLVKPIWKTTTESTEKLVRKQKQKK